MSVGHTTIKICGITDLPNGCKAIDEGAEFLGFVFYPPSHRFLEVSAAASLITLLRAARPAGWQAVGVFVNEPLTVVDAALKACHLDVVQLNGEETADYVRHIAAPVFKAIRVSPDHLGRDGAPGIPSAESLGAERVLVDANVPGQYGGTGVTYDWTAVRAAVRDGFLAGGLTPENVGRAIAEAQPWGVDVSSGVERANSKDPELIERFVRAVREAEA